MWRECHCGIVWDCLNSCLWVDVWVDAECWKTVFWRLHRKWHDKDDDCHRIWHVLAKKIFICCKCNRKYMNIYNIALGGCSKEDLVNPALVRDYWTNILRICLRNLEFVFTDLVWINRGFILSSLKWNCPSGNTEMSN